MCGKANWYGGGGLSNDTLFTSCIIISIAYVDADDDTSERVSFDDDWYATYPSRNELQACWYDG